ncbi:polysaccharide pyruvyl transferase family protein [Microbulbifer sp. TYP-18]|uniref:polysaccharide pyruvyl transferase family protein n=1 Tax=Microbulbifer sp. TYP-18 TaxID=3230024 RepID=UPI0034C6D13E
MKEVSIVAATFYGNRGAEGMLSTTIGKLRDGYPGDLRFNVFSYYPQRDLELVNDERISIYSSTPAYLVLVLFPCSVLFRILGFFRFYTLQKSLPNSVQALARSEMLVCLAGVSFVEGRAKFLPFNIATIVPAILLNIPVVKFAQAMGPFRSLVNRLAAKLILGRCRQVFTRGEETHGYLHSLFRDRPLYQRADDVAFLFAKEYCISSPAPGLDQRLDRLQVLRAAGHKVVGVCPSVVIAKRAEAAGWDYRLRMLELINGLTQRGYVVVLYPNATRGEDMDKTHNNDLPLLAAIASGLTQEVKEKVVYFIDSLNIGQIHRIISACDVQAVSRFHAMVASLASGVPVMVIGWSHKYLEVMERFRQGDMVLDYTAGSVEPALNCIEKLLFECRTRIDQITAALPEVQQMSNMQLQYLLELLKSKE